MIDGGRGGKGAGEFCAVARDLLPLHFYGLVEDGEKDALERHLAACADCGSAWRETRAILGSVDAEAAFPRESEVDWPGFAQETVLRARQAERLGAERLDAKHLGAERSVASSGREAEQVRAARPAPFRSVFRPAWAWGSLAALAAVLMVLMGVRTWRPEASGAAGSTAPVTEAVSPEAARFLQQGLARRGAARYLRDSRALLVDLVHAPVRCRRADGSLDVALEKERSQELLRRKNLYLDTLGGPADRRLADLVRQLETLLVQVSTLDDCAAARQIRDLREEIERHQILLRIDLVASEVEGGSSRA